jgi:hypothetical protein
MDRYVRWNHLRRMNQLETVPHGTFLRSKQIVTGPIDVLNWLIDSRPCQLRHGSSM